MIPLPQRAPDITVVIPTLNEEPYVHECLHSVLTEDAERVLEVLVIDGDSDDGTPERVEEYSKTDPRVRLVHNPRRTAAAALNLGLEAAAGAYFVRLDAHSVYPKGYLSRLVDALEEYDADVSGGAIRAVARRPSLLGRAVAASLGNPFVIGNSAFRVGGGAPRLVDTVPFGCWRTGLLRAVGGYNEELHRSQDYELAGRLRARGARTILLPDVVITYRSRSGLWENAKYNFWNGYWVGYPAAGMGVAFAPRHFAPGFAVVLGTAWLALVRPLGLVAFLLVPYAALLLLSALATRREALGVAVLQPPIALMTHVTYGLGEVWGGLAGLLHRQWAGSGPFGRRCGSAAPHCGAAVDQSASDTAGR